MCSVIGLYSFSGRLLEPNDFIENGMRIMQNRGPNGSKVDYINDRIIIGHQRLSIIDLSSAGDQPMESDISVIAFNGEIYNYIELKSELIACGFKFKTDGDTEVLQKLIDHYGFQIGLNKLNGMFAFAYLDKRDERLYLIRDRFGVKPLYYTMNKDILAFSSEIKPLYSIHSGLTINQEAVNSYLSDCATDYDDSTFILEINQILPGQYICINSNRDIKKNIWYRPSIENRNQDSINYQEEYENLLVDAISLRLRADVPLCITLSGGIDSSTIYTLIKERLKIPVTIFTYDHPGGDISEFERVQKLANKYGDPLVVVTGINDDKLSIGDIENDLQITEYPIWSFSTRAYKEIYDKIHKMGFKVVIEGHGADEFLAGYGYMIRQACLDELKSLRLVNTFKLLKTYIHTEYSTNFLKNYIKALLGLILSAILKRGVTQKFDEIIEVTYKYKILPMVLRAFDRLSMNNSIESRAPFMDYRLIEYSRKLPVNYLISEIGNKAILRNILKKYNNSFIYEFKNKIGFSSNLKKILSSKELCQQIEGLLSTSDAAKNYPKYLRKSLDFFKKNGLKNKDSFEECKFVLLILFINALK